MAHFIEENRIEISENKYTNLSLEWIPVGFIDPIKPQREKQESREKPATLKNHNPSPSAHVGIILLTVLTFPIGSRK